MYQHTSISFFSCQILEILFCILVKECVWMGHELTHLREKNHQKPFWNLVNQWMPEYELIIKAYNDISLPLTMRYSFSPRVTVMNHDFPLLVTLREPIAS